MSSSAWSRSAISSPGNKSNRARWWCCRWPTTARRGCQRWNFCSAPSSNITKFPVAPQPDHNIGAAAGHRMNLSVRRLRLIGCQASGFISDDGLVTAVRTETCVHHYDQVILATGRQPGTWLARALRRDPAHRL
ncbi:MAG TPA: hypothetical protein VGQ26_02650, partial [Streptosporangiaceae bacterium]|nr:hypothetical protein [Streptosporangiaceae bacterium]